MGSSSLQRQTAAPLSVARAPRPTPTEKTFFAPAANCGTWVIAWSVLLHFECRTHLKHQRCEPSQPRGTPSGIHRSRFGISRVRVLTVTTSESRCENIRIAASAVSGGQGIFLQTYVPSEFSPDTWLGPIWRSVANAPVSLFDSPGPQGSVIKQATPLQKPDS